MAGYHKGLVIFSLNWISLLYGFMQGQTAGLIGALRNGDEGILLSEGQISLIAAFLTFNIVFGLLYAAVLGERFSRKWCYALCSIPEFINWIILYYAKSFPLLMLSRSLAGASLGALGSLNTGVTSEFTTQSSRALHLTLVTVLSPAIGASLAHVLGVLLHWRSMALMGIFLSAIQLLLPYFWLESPHWLAMKGRLEECQEVFRKLHGHNENTEKELALLVKMETSKQMAANATISESGFKRLLRSFKKRYFWELMLISTILISYYAAAGKVVFVNLATVMLQEMTGASDVLFYTLLTDGFSLMGSCVAFIVLKKMSIRSMLFSSGLMGVGVLLVLSACLYFRNGEVYFQWINVTLLALYFIIVNAGPYPVMEILLGEMYPLELKLYFYFLNSPIIMSTMFLSIMIMPALISAMGYHGLFLLNSAIMVACLAFLYVRLPETKGKTLQEIEVYFKTKHFDADGVLTNNEQIKSLI